MFLNRTNEDSGGVRAIGSEITGNS